MLNKRKDFGIYTAIAAVLILVVVFAAMTNKNVKKSISIEAGGELPKANDFLLIVP
jgi:hypothetical protein